MAKIVTGGPEQTEALGEKLGTQLHGGELVAFTGGMGAGKTTFCRGLARGLGCVDEASSPTFAIVNLYRGPVPLAHFDAWRITCAEDLETAGLYDYLEQGAVVALEWSEKTADWLDAPDIRVDIEILDDMARRITIEGAVL